MLERRSVKAGRGVGRWAVNPRDSNRLDSARTVESMSADDDGDEGTAEIAFPTCAVPTDGANLRGSTPANPMVKEPGLVRRSTGWTIARRLTGGYVPARYY